ncbi:MAG: PEGA domain-containing protein [Deltaproteobacteria bacterium]|nr:PEGA domain-containing protein [Deltaproteobacteria bacterium]
MARRTGWPGVIHVAVILLLSLAAGPAGASGYAEAEKAFAMGQLLVDLGDTTRGLFELKKAASIVPSGRYLREIVKVYRELNREEQALSWGERYLRVTPAEEQDEALVAWLASARERLRGTRARVAIRVFPEDARLEFTGEDGESRTAVSDEGDGRTVWWLPPGRGSLTVQRDGWAPETRTLELRAGASEDVTVELAPALGEGDLAVEASVAGAEVVLDGRVAGIAPLQVTRPAGRYIIQVWARDHAEWTGFATVLPGQATRVQVHLARAAGAGRPQAAPMVWTPPRGGLSLRGWGWITMGLGVALGGVAGYTGWASFDHASAAAKWDAGTPQRARLARDMQAYWAATLGLGSVGGAAVAGGLLMVLLDRSKGKDREATLEMLSFAPGFGPDGFTLSTGITF